MVEVQMVNRMIKRGALLAPVVIAALWILQGPRWGLSAAVGLALALGNLVLASRIIGGVATHSPHLLVPAAMTAFALGLALLAGIGFALKRTDAVDFLVMGLTLIGAHLGLVLWEAAGAYERANDIVTAKTADQRS
jgi:hypothetical protein